MPVQSITALGTSNSSRHVGAASSLTSPVYLIPIARRGELPPVAPSLLAPETPFPALAAGKKQRGDRLTIDQFDRMRPGGVASDDNLARMAGKSPCRACGIGRIGR